MAGGRRETLMGHDQNIIIKQRMKCLSQDGPIYLFILFLNLKHCISFAKHQNESVKVKFSLSRSIIITGMD